MKTRKSKLSRKSKRNYSNKSKRTKITQNYGKKYFVHDNGDRPFMVLIHNNNISIFTYDTQKDNFNAKYYTILLKRYNNVNKIFIGKGNNKNELGNSILIKIKKNHFVFIGKTIYEFKVNDDIQEYYSYIGNNDVPYPVAVGAKFVYFFIENAILSKTLFTDFPEKYSWSINAYDKYYGNFDNLHIKSRHTRARLMKKLSKTIPNQKIIHRRRIT